MYIIIINHVREKLLSNVSFYLPQHLKKKLLAQSGHLLSNKVLLAEIFLREPPPRASEDDQGEDSPCGAGWGWRTTALAEKPSPKSSLRKKLSSRKDKTIVWEHWWKLTEARVSKWGWEGLSLWCRGRNVCSSQGYIWKRGNNTCQSHTPEFQIDNDCLQLRPIRTSENGPSPSPHPPPPPPHAPPPHEQASSENIAGNMAGRAAEGRFSLGSSDKGVSNPSMKIKSQAEDRHWQKPSWKLVHPINRSYHYSNMKPWCTKGNHSNNKLQTQPTFWLD